MKNHLLHLLRAWQPHKDDQDWVLGLIYETHGSCYRKAGTMMLFNSLGQQLGMLSGGCLESDIQRNARKVMQDQKARCLTYDDTDEDDVAFKLGVGCGGVVKVILLPILKSLNYLLLEESLQRMESGETACWQHIIKEGIVTESAVIGPLDTDLFTSRQFNKNKDIWLKVAITPPPHILIVGGGMDAISVCQTAANLGWQVSIWDPRPGYAKAHFFKQADQILRHPADALSNYIQHNNISAAVVMSHHKVIDASVLASIYEGLNQNSPLRYLAMLGPVHRKQEVIQLSGINEETSSLKIAGPAGLDIGNCLPESIALAIVAECHAALAGKSGHSVSGVLTGTVGSRNTKIVENRGSST